jgi:heme exporter protein A
MRPVLNNISFSLTDSSSLAITGKNGSGKSTLSKILAGVLSATQGSVAFMFNGVSVNAGDFKKHIGFVSPYLNLYDEFTAMENIRILSRIRTNADCGERVKELLTDVELWKRRNDIVGTYSSGMKQRLKYVFALLNRPAILILDEPTASLDTDGIEFVRNVVVRQKKDGIIIIASNDVEEANWCTKKVKLQPPD